MNNLKRLRVLLHNRQLGIFLAAVLVATIAPQFSNAKSAVADDGGYPWSGATALDVSQYDWGYSPCPSNASGCMGIPYPDNPFTDGLDYGMEDPYTMEFRNCTSYAAWKINQYVTTDMSGWGNAADWPSNAPSADVHAASGYTPVAGDLAVWDSPAPYGHVAYVSSVNGSGIASLDEYNVAGTGLFTSNRTTASTSARPPDYYIHLGGSGPPPEINYLITRSGSTLQGKDGIDAPWTALDTIATDEQSAGTRIAEEDSGDNIWAKDTLGADWYEEASSVDQYAVSSDLLLTRSGTTVQGKAGLTDGWTTLSTGATDMKVAGSRIAALDNSGNLWAKDTISGTWYEEAYGPITQYAVTPDYLFYRDGNDLYGKAGLTDGWSALSTSASDVQADGMLIAMTDTSGNIWAKYTLGGTWHDESSSVAQYAVSSDYLLIRIGNQVSGKPGTSDADLTGGWTILYNPASDFKVGGSRIAVVDNSTGELWAKDTLGGDWYDESSPVDQYSVTSTLTGEP
jgi:hypothetical protein